MFVPVQALPWPLCLPKSCGTNYFHNFQPFENKFGVHEVGSAGAGVIITFSQVPDNILPEFLLHCGREFFSILLPQLAHATQYLTKDNYHRPSCLNLRSP